jgi:ATP-dependent DNA helicase RecG
MQPEKGGFAPELWSDIAAVRRTVEWHSVDPERVVQAKFMGATCVRLLERCLSSETLTDDARESLDKIKTIMLGFDALDAEARAVQLVSAQNLLSQLVSIGELGARHKGRQPRSRLSRPESRDRKPRQSAAAKEAKEPEEAPAESAEKSEVGAPEAEQGTQEQAAVSEERPARREPRRPRPPPALPRLALGHPEGTGRPVSALAGCTEELAAKLEAAGISTLTDLIGTPPVGHTRVPVARLDPEQDLDAESGLVLIRGKIEHRSTRFSAGTSRREVLLSLKKGGHVRAVWVDAQPRGWAGWQAGMELALAGTPVKTEDGWDLHEAEPVGMDGRGSGLLPTYGVDGFDDLALRDLIALALIETVDRLREPLPREVVDRYKLVELGEALRDAHFPSNSAGRGRARLAFDEMLMLQAGIAWRGKARQRGRGIAHKVLHRFIGDLEAQKDLVLTDAQEAAFSEIRRDLQSHHPMVRLLQGEAGTDKSSLALLSAAVISDGSTQVAWIMVDGAAAERRCLFAEGTLRAVGISSMLVNDKPDRGQADSIKRGNAQVIFGTHALLEAELEWNRLGLVIVEERSSYGTVDPSKLVKEGPAPDLLVITDPPIPSSLTLTIFGEYQVTMIDREGSQEGSCTVYPVTQRAEAYAEARDVVEKGGQAYVVFPVGDEGDLLGVDDALRFAEALQADSFPGARIGVYCSAMSREDRLRVFADFEQRRIDVLVCTTFVEEAPMVPSATAMVIEHADNNSLIRLHRLRGHVAHGSRAGCTVAILSDEPSEEGKLRVERLCQETDGYRIAEMDLQERGLAEVLGERATEAPAMRWADPVKDRELLLRAREESFRLVRQDPGMRRWTEFGQAVRMRWGEWLGDGLPEPTARAEGERSPGSGGGRRRRRRRRR